MTTLSPSYIDFLKIWEPQNLLETSGAVLGLLDLQLYIIYSLTEVPPLIRTLSAGIIGLNDSETILYKLARCYHLTQNVLSIVLKW